MTQQARREIDFLLLTLAIPLLASEAFFVIHRSSVLAHDVPPKKPLISPIYESKFFSPCDARAHLKTIDTRVEMGRSKKHFEKTKTCFAITKLSIVNGEHLLLNFILFFASRRAAVSLLVFWSKGNGKSNKFHR